jgi:hypothetical protein
MRFVNIQVPGKPSVELLPGGKDTAVTLDNLGKYVDAVTRTILVEGISRQFAAFQSGFNEVSYACRLCVCACVRFVQRNVRRVTRRLLLNKSQYRYYCGSRSEIG